jgi:EAL domain-containing protein (putative c-di-GMP-specific phosphodiesterase class I)
MAHHDALTGVRNRRTFEQEMAAENQGVFSNWANNAVYEAITHRDGMIMFYQPIVPLDGEADPSTCDYVALVRIRHDGEWILPSNTFPRLEARSLELELDHAIVSRTMEDLRAGRIPRGSGISINLSGPSLVHEGLCRLLEDFAPFLIHDRIVLEITETTLFSQLSMAIRNLQVLRTAGLKIALDDFGSGYSSLRYLASMPVDIVNFDINLIRGLTQEPQRHIVHHLAHMIIESGYTMVAEGIDSEELLERVRALGFDYGQGYYFGRPLHPEEIPAPERSVARSQRPRF